MLRLEKENSFETPETASAVMFKINAIKNTTDLTRLLQFTFVLLIPIEVLNKIIGRPLNA